MPLFKGEGCKSTPQKVINYITDEKKAKIITSNALDDERSYVEQFRETAKLYGKCNTFDERKYYHFKLSCAQSDNVTPEQSHELAEEMVKEYFLNYECVIATHNDTKTIHSHIIVNAINFETGKKFHCNNQEYASIKDKANELGLARGLSVLDWRKPSMERITTIERRIQIKGGISWKEELREVIAEALKQVTNFTEFSTHLEKYGVTIERNTEKTISFKHPNKIKPVRGEKLGQGYTKGAIMNGITEQRNRRTSTEQEFISGATSPTNRNKTKRIRKQSIESSIDGVQRTVRAVAEGIKEYTPIGREELREREATERRENERIAKERASAEERQRIIDRKNEQRDSGFDFER